MNVSRASNFHPNAVGPTDRTDGSDGRLDVCFLPNLNVHNQFANDDRCWVKKEYPGPIDTFNLLVFLLAWSQLRLLGVEVVRANNLKGMRPSAGLAAWVLRLPVVHVIRHDWLVCPSSTRFNNRRASAGSVKRCRHVSAPKTWFYRLLSHAISVRKCVLDEHREQNLFTHATQSVIHDSRPSITSERTQLTKPHASVRVGVIGRTGVTKGIGQCFGRVVEAIAVTSAIEVHIAGRENENVLPTLFDKRSGLKVVYRGFMERQGVLQERGPRRDHLDMGRLLLSVSDRPIGVLPAVDCLGILRLVGGVRGLARFIGTARRLRGSRRAYHEPRKSTSFLSGPCLQMGRTASELHAGVTHS